VLPELISMKKLSNFDEEQAELITARIIQKITIIAVTSKTTPSRQHRLYQFFK
jgi:hypothetical protein